MRSGNGYWWMVERDIYTHTHTHTHTTHYKMAKQYIIYITLQCNKNIAIEISKGENYEFFWFIVVKCSWTVDE